MLTIPLRQIPNQSVSFNADGAYWRIRVYQAIDNMYADISRNDAVIITGIRCLVGQPLLPYRYMYAPDFGNLVFDNNPDWQTFGDTCNLNYLNSEELLEYELMRLTA